MIVRQKIDDILVSQQVEKYLTDRGLMNALIKRKNNILQDNYTSGMRFKILQPKHRRIFSSRLNQKYRLICIIEGSVCKVMSIDDHQNL